MFIFFFGTRRREERRGIVAEHCPRCGDARPFAVIEHYQVGHFYYIPLGRGSLQATSIRCVNCASEFSFEPREYSRILSESEARSCSTDELVRRTNPRLAQSVPPPSTASAPTMAVRLPPSPSQVACLNCGYQRERQFRFCPVCGTPRAT